MHLPISTVRPLHPPRWRRAMAFAAPFRLPIAGILGLTLLTAGLNAVEPVAMKYVFDNLQFARWQPLVTAVLALAAVALVREVAGAASSWLTWHTRLGIHHRLLDATVSRLHRLPLSFHRSEGVGAIMTKLDRSIQGFIGAVSEILFNVLPAVIYLGMSIVIMLQLEWRLALLVAAFAPLPALIAARAAPEQVQRERTLLDRWSQIYSRFNEVLSGIVTVRSFVMEDVEKGRFLKDVAQANSVVIRGVRVDAKYTGLTNGVVAAARIGALALGGWMILKGQTTTGTLVAFLGYLGGLFGPVQGLSGIYQTMRKATVSLDEIFSILDEQDLLGDAPHAREPGELRGDVSFRGVKFRYDTRNRPLLDGVNLDVPAGATLAIVGPSGSGKSTLMALLMRFYDPDQGSITLDGINVRDLKQAWLRRNIGVVLQEPLLFNDTVRNNIAYGKPEASMDEVIAAAKAANAHDFILRLPDGYNTMTGERGGRLSVGERQRITIARALIKNPPLVVLDEATSSLDAESEALVQEALERLIANRTTFVIAHRLSTVVHADRIIVLKEGKIVEQGTHPELLKASGYYANLVKQQTSGLIRNVGE